MPDEVHRLVEKEKLRDVLLDELEVPVAGKVGDVLDGAGNEVVNADNTMAAGEQQVGQVRAKKTRGAGDDAGGRVAGGGGVAAGGMGFTSPPCR